MLENNFREVPKNLPIGTADAEIVVLMTEFIYYTGENVVYSLDLLPYYC
jgi:hypothetical protein